MPKDCNKGKIRRGKKEIKKKNTKSDSKTRTRNMFLKRLLHAFSATIPFCTAKFTKNSDQTFSGSEMDDPLDSAATESTRLRIAAKKPKIPTSHQENKIGSDRYRVGLHP